MGFLAPISAIVAAAVVIPPLVALYFLKLRRQEVAVPTTLLWRKAIEDLQVNAPFQKLRRNLLLVLQLLLLAALLLAFARPTREMAAAPGQRAVILIDHSASMNAVEGGTTRLERAKRVAEEIVAGLGADGSSGGAMVVSFAAQPRVLAPFTGDTAVLRDAVRSVPPTDQAGRLDAALRLVAPFAQQAAADTEQSLVAYILSDGRVHEAGEPLALPGAQVRFVQVAEREAGAANVGFTSFSARRDFERPQVVQVFARLSNDGAQRVELTVSLHLDGRVQSAQRAEIPAATAGAPGSRSLRFDLTLAGAGLIEVRHDHADALAADDAARLHLAPARPLRVLLVTPGNAFLARAFRSVGVRELVTMTPQAYEDQDAGELRRGSWSEASTTGGIDAGFDLIVFDRYAPRAVPPVSSVSFEAAPPIEGLELVPAGEGAGGPEVVLDWDRGHPLMRHVALDDVLVEGAGRLALPNRATVLATGQGGPILAEVPAEGTRHVVASFDVLRSNWPLYVSFPVFVNNAVQTLGLGSLGDAAGLAYQPGDVAVVPLLEAVDALAYEGPVALRGRVNGLQAILPVFARAGVYGTTSAAVDPPYDTIPVNLLDSTESDLRPAAVLSVGSAEVAGTPESRAVRREVWPWFVAAALVLLMVEWVVYTRRMHL